MERNKISVVIPCYNYGRFIVRCVNSVLMQTYKNYEIIIVDDYSDEKTRTLIKQQRAKNKKIIKTIFNSKNLGTATSRNKGIERASGDYILLLDADDYLLTRCLEKLIVAHKKYEEDIIYSKNIRLSATGTRTGVEGQSYSIERLKNYECVMFVTSLFKKEHWNEVGRFDTSMVACEDWEFWINMAKHSHYGKLIDDILWCRTDHKTSKFETTDSHRMDEVVRQLREKHHPGFLNEQRNWKKKNRRTISTPINKQRSLLIKKYEITSRNKERVK